MALPRPSKIICVGKNYLAHARELGGEVPQKPLLFLKAPSSLLGVGEVVRLPQGAGRVDYEGEIGVVVGWRAKNLRESEALSAVSGFVPLNDITARDLQRRDDQWSRAKGFDTFCPVGDPTPVGDLDPGALEVITRVNGEVRQHGRSSDMAFSIPYLLAYISRIMTLEPGDLVATGTPEGVGPLQHGDVVEVEIPGVGRVSNPVARDDEGWDWSEEDVSGVAGG
ncbi:MAG: fumarylacetoacetate hydrolase family protein [Gemmatimonadota bacterium]